MRLKTTALCLCLWFTHSTPTQAQPDYRGEEATESDVYHGVEATASVPKCYHFQNEGGSDGSGLCVICAMIQAGAKLNVADMRKLKRSQLWIAAKGAPGGYYPEKLDRLLKDKYPEQRWLSVENTDTAMIEFYTAQGIPVAATMNTGRQYSYQRIHHFVVVVHLDKEWACIVDNNDPGKYHWMPRQEYNRRYVDGTAGWFVVWLSGIKPVKTYYAAAALIAALTIGCVGMLFMLNVTNPTTEPHR